MLNKKSLLAAVAGVLLVGGAVVGVGFAANDGPAEDARGYTGDGAQPGWRGMLHRGGHGMMRPAMTPEEMDARIRERFARVDRNSDGVLDRAEIETMLRERRPGRGAGSGMEHGMGDRMGHGMMHGMGRGMGGDRGDRGPQAGAPEAGPGPGMQSGRMLRRFDENRDGKVSKDEFLGSMKKRFAEMDLDNDGKITDADLPPTMRGQEILKSSGGGDGPGRMGRMGHILQWLRAADGNHDGVVTLEEVTARAEKQFVRLDRNGDGVIDQADRDIVRKEMVDYGVQRFLHRFGADKDGKVTREQFTKVAKERMTRMAAEGGGMGYRGKRHHGSMHGPGMGMGPDRMGPGSMDPGSMGQGGMMPPGMMGRDRPDGQPSPPATPGAPAPGAGPDGQRRL